ncbi:hypothetical protein FJZ18_04660 [Candidatus Pacearchaeota archaeon]|nr:hypothetical protein [Candidatus Pacearchaeota archaeon]
MDKEKRISELELEIDVLHARLLHTLPERQEKGKKEIRARLARYYVITGRRYVPVIERRKYESGEF